jgi:2-keto-4-pentenoate hydratase/2-oxohepta-3-ene-1,7-dioic acid hydratase in catechol pathway
MWGVVEGSDDDALTVATIAGHPFAEITFTGDRWALDDVRLLSPILPSKVVAIGKNYAEHAREMGSDLPSLPLIFLKPSTSVIGHRDAIRLPASSQQVDHEAELALIIGRPAKDVPRAEALRYLLGYTCANDVTARDQQRADVQYTRAKGYDSFCPLGPWIETAFDAADVRITAAVNGEIRQDGRTRDMLHDPSALIEFISGVMTLLPGDVILTGTPAGVGQIHDGDMVEIHVEGLGTLSNPARAA